MFDYRCRLATLDDKPYVSHHLYEEAIIEHPTPAVWKQALDIGAWTSAHRLEPLSGTADEVGFFERVHLRDLPRGTGEANYHFNGIAETNPNKLIALKGAFREGRDPR